MVVFWEILLGKGGIAFLNILKGTFEKKLWGPGIDGRKFVKA